MPYSQFAATTQFFLYGTRHFNETGYERHVKAYKEPAFLDSVDLRGKVFMVTGANAGLGREITQFLASKGARVYLVCRNAERGAAAVAEISAAVVGADLHVLKADCGLEADVRRCWEEFAAAGSRLDGLVCNAGALLNDKQLTTEGVEVTFASHLLFGTYLLSKLAMPFLVKSQGRLVFMSSGGMYQTRFPDWDTVNALSGAYDGQMSYCYMKRAQVLLAERWAREQPDIKVVSCHPGWSGTEGVDKAFGSKKSMLEPLRTTWEGAEGTCWLLTCPFEAVQSGAYYLDREPQVKHMAGPFFTEGSFTKNTEAEVDVMLEKLEAWTNGQRPSAEELRERHVAHVAGSDSRQEGKLKPMPGSIDLKSFMGIWHVISSVPTFFDKDTINGVEKYELDEQQKQISVDFTCMDPGRTKTSSIGQTAKVVNAHNTEWQLRVKLGPLPLSLSYLVIYCSEDYSTCVVGNPDRTWLYIMARESVIEAAELERLKNIAESAGYSRALIKDVPQLWSDAAVGA